MSSIFGQPGLLQFFLTTLRNNLKLKLKNYKFIWLNQLISSPLCRNHALMANLFIEHLSWFQQKKSLIKVEFLSDIKSTGFECYIP